MAAQAHARSANQARARRQSEQIVDGLVRVGVVRLEGLSHIPLRCHQYACCPSFSNSTTGWQTNLLHLPLVPLVGAGHVVGQGVRAGEVVVAARGGNNVALAGNLAGEAGYGAGDLVNLAEEEDTGEAAGSVSEEDLYRNPDEV